jgi:hypothetical protein
MSAFQNQARETNVKLVSVGSGVTGVVDTDVTVTFKKTGDTAFSTKTMDTSNWTEIADGYYTIQWDDTEMDTLGSFLYRVVGGAFDTVEAEFEIEPVPLTLSAPADTCIVSGNVADLTGVASVGEKVTFRIVDLPKAIGSTIVVGKLLVTTADAMGSFSVALLRNSTVLVEIQSAGLKSQIIIPDQETANLIDLLPPL